MKNFRNTSLAIVLFLTAAFTSCKKGGEANPQDQPDKFTNSAQLFFDDNSGVSLESNDAVKATYADKKLKISFSQNGADVALEIPNYDISTSQAEYTNANALFSVTKNAKTYTSVSIFIPVIVGNPPYPVFVNDKFINIKTSNLKVDETTTDVSVQIVGGSELITAPVSNGSAPVYNKIGFVQGAGGKPNMITARIKQ
jgi:hypothetical protein